MRKEKNSLKWKKQLKISFILWLFLQKYIGEEKGFWLSIYLTFSGVFHIEFWKLF